jgi:3-dehydroquinate synthase
MLAATHLAGLTGVLPDRERDLILRAINLYGPIPSLRGIEAGVLVRRTNSDKKTIHGKVHFVLPDRIGHVVIRSGIDPEMVRAAAEAAMA